MPIQVKDFTWQESETHVFITVPLKAVRTQNVDIFTIENYIKVNYPPYFFDSWLFANVDDLRGKAEVGNGAVVFKLEKEEPKIWGQLHHPDATDKSKMIAFRASAIDRHQTREEETKKKKAERKREMDSYAVKQQMALEDEERQRTENIKQSERRQATEDLENWKQKQIDSAKDNLNQQNSIDLFPAGSVPSPSSPADIAPAKSKISHGTSPSIKAPSQQKKPSKKLEPEEIFHAEANGIPLRKSATISVNFTERAFPTAARESTADEENAWLKKQNEVRRIRDVADSELSENEKDPVWLRDKGNEFFKAGI